MPKDNTTVAKGNGFGVLLLPAVSKCRRRCDRQTFPQLYFAATIIRFEMAMWRSDRDINTAICRLQKLAFLFFMLDMECV
jgi:hypothetical protein